MPLPEVGKPRFLSFFCGPLLGAGPVYHYSKPGIGTRDGGGITIIEAFRIGFYEGGALWEIGEVVKVWILGYVRRCKAQL